MDAFENNVTMIGFGSVAKCALPMMINDCYVDPKKVTVIDFAQKDKALKPFISQGVKYVQKKIEPETLDNILSEHTKRGDFIVDLAWNIGANDIIGWCHDTGVMYMNSSVEVWDSQSEMYTTSPEQKSLYHRQMALRKMIQNWPEKSSTAVVDFGANPGLITAFTKKALLDIAQKAIAEKKYSSIKREKIEQYFSKKDFARLAMILGVKVIHCSERDTQISKTPKQVNEFLNTWSPEGFREEGTAPAEMGWGTHEKILPKNAFSPKEGPGNQIFLAQMGVNTYVRSFVPGHEIRGMIVRHGEAFGLSDRLTVRNKNGQAAYRPTVHYAYMPCDAALASLVELAARNYQMQPNWRVMDDKEIISGEDILGALVMGHKYNSWWTGSILSIEQAREIVPGQNATTIQVAAGVESCFAWAIKNRNKGFCLPEDLPHDEILTVATPYLGNVVSEAYDWTPLQTRHQAEIFKENPHNSRAKGNIWQFQNFLLPL